MSELVDACLVREELQDRHLDELTICHVEVHHALQALSPSLVPPSARPGCCELTSTGQRPIGLSEPGLGQGAKIQHATLEVPGELVFQRERDSAFDPSVRKAS